MNTSTPYPSKEKRRRSIRLGGFDYSQPGEYFITIVTQKRTALFGSINDSEMHLNSLGKIVRDEWMNSPTIRREVELGAFVIMPNHFHAIVHLKEIDEDFIPIVDPQSISRGDRPVAPTKRPGPKPRSLSSLIGGFKSSVTKQINEYRGKPGMPVWQRNYYDQRKMIASLGGLIFKEGSCLRKCYFPDYRFSEDLDFVAMKHLSHT